MKKVNIFLLSGAVALLVAIADLPYGYYQLLRWAVCGIGIYSVYLAYKQKKKAWIWTFGIIALVFNPIFRFHFGKAGWQVIDVMAGIIYLIGAFKVKPKHK
jgi:hypothetical protein